jgi:4-hydroxy-tetrahydrodipicolinate reductase
MRKPYRVAVWGPGDVGSICIREAARLPEFEVVGAYVYSEHKDGVDIGKLVGIEPLGVDATRDVDEFLAIDSDVVLYTALDLPGGNALNDFVKLLEAGKNVLTSQPYNYMPARPPEFGTAIEAAAARGGSTFHAGGLNPDFITHRWALGMTTLTQDVSQIIVEEYYDCSHQANESTLRLIGLGGDPGQAMRDDSPARWYQEHYWFAMLRQVAAAMGVEISRIEATSSSVPAPEELVAPSMTIKKGETGRVAYESIAYVGDQPFLSMKVGWYLTEKMKPAGVTADCEWIATIEGRPSVRSVLSLGHSFLTDVNSFVGEPAAPGYYTFGVTLVQAIPAVVDAPPGILGTDMPRAHWKRDQRLGAPKPIPSLTSGTASR